MCSHDSVYFTTVRGSLKYMLYPMSLEGDFIINRKEAILLVSV